jgi:hypothetical protein
MTTRIQFTPDERAQVHEVNAIRLLCADYRSHEDGLPEWVKNSNDAYVIPNVPKEDRLIVVFFRNKDRGHPAAIGCLDLIGMTVDDIESRFRVWADPEAASRGLDVDVTGGHGNGGKCYMTQMFDNYAYLHTVRDGRACKYGFLEGKPVPGYFPDPTHGRDFKVASLKDELAAALQVVGCRIKDLPYTVQPALEKARGFTLVAGVGPKDVSAKLPVGPWIEALRTHPQMILPIQANRIFAVVDGHAHNDGKELTLPDIEPLPNAKTPRLIAIPEMLRDPDSGDHVSTTRGGAFRTGELELRTSSVSMRWGLKPRHSIVFRAQRRFAGAIDVREFIRSAYGDRIYGECRLDTFIDYIVNPRSRPAKSPVTRAVEDWIAKQIEAYAAEFVKLEQLRASQEEKHALSRMNAALAQWANKFIDFLGPGKAGEDGGPGRLKPPRPEPLPRRSPAKIRVRLTHHVAGIGVALRPTIEFFDAKGERVHSIPYLWHNGDSRIATVDSQLLTVLTHAAGETEIWAETPDGLKSNNVRLQVVDVRRLELEPRSQTLSAGSRSQISALAHLRDGTTVEGVYLIWFEDNPSVARVSSSGVVYAVGPGKCEISAGDDRCTAEEPAAVEVTPASGGDHKGRGYPQILLSEIDTDPLHPDQEPPKFAPEEGPVCQPSPEYVDENIWWINMACPLARRYLDEARGSGSKTREWRVYHLERMIEAHVKIRLSHAFLQGEELSFDIMEQRWRELQVRMQEEAAAELQAFLEAGELPAEV